MRSYTDKCEELGLPIPKEFDTQIAYIEKAIADGHTFDTRKARYIGIGNLHSTIPKLNKKGVDFTLKHGCVIDPFTGEVPPFQVDIIFMTPEQIAIYNIKKGRE